ncbi:MAG: DUF488 domain-containing protein [Acidobacteria bacterium]|nr:DUF488 domain-containing protein [Acidobacteriota bacterium]
MRIFTLGTSNRSPAEFLAVLRAYEIRIVADVRRFPTSRRFEHFRRENLARLLVENQIEYVFLGAELGGYRQDGYEAHMRSDTFQAGVSRLEWLVGAGNVTIICAEKTPERCHRRHVARYLAERGWDVQHIIDADDVRPESGQPSLF